MEILDKVVLGNPILGWIVAGVSFALIWGMIEGLKRWLAGRFAKVAAGKPGSVQEFIATALEKKTKSIFLFAVSFYLGSTLLLIPTGLERALKGAAIISLSIQVAIWCDALLYYLIQGRRAQLFEKDPGAVSAFATISFVSRVGLWAVMALLGLNNLGVDITALVAGLGIGGIAIALAAQNILGDLFASVSIVLDKPFAIGDFIIIGEFQGDVEYIGVKTTRIRSISGEQIVFSNTDLLQSRVRNYKRMNERRAVFTINIPFGTPDDKLRAVPGVIRKIVESKGRTRFDRAHFSAIGEYSYQFEIVYIVLTSDYTAYKDVQQEINLDIVARLKELGVEPCYPTRMNYQVALPPKQ